MDTKLIKLEQLNKKLKPPQELGGVFLPRSCRKQFAFMFIAEMPSMNEPKGWDRKSNYNFDVTTRDNFFQETMIKYGVGGSYVTDIVKERDVPRRPTKAEIKKWLPFLIEEIKIIQPEGIVVLGKRTYEVSFKPFVEPLISKEIKIDYVFHYSSQVPRVKFEKKFKDVVSRMRNNSE